MIRKNKYISLGLRTSIIVIYSFTNINQIINITTVGFSNVMYV